MSFKTTLGKLLDHRRTVVHLNGREVDQIRYLREEEGKRLYWLETFDGIIWYFLDQDVLLNDTGDVGVNEYPCFANDDSTCTALLTFRTLKPVTQSDLEN